MFWENIDQKSHHKKIYGLTHVQNKENHLIPVKYPLNAKKALQIRPRLLSSSVSHYGWFNKDYEFFLIGTHAIKKFMG